MEQKKKNSKKESAIDRLRESQERLDQLDVPDFTTKSISFDQGDQSLKYIQKVINENKDKEATVPVESTRVIKKIKSKKKEETDKDLSLTDTLIRMGATGRIKLKRTLYQENEKEESKLTEHQKKSNSFKFRLIVFLCIVLVIAGLLVGYAYKTIIYDPQHLVTQSMEKTYQTLQGYADEWSMSSDTEKSELLNYQKKYDQLTDEQKTNINAYFKEQTGKKLTTIFTNLKKAKAQQEADRLNQLSTFINNWATYTEDQKATIVSYEDTYDSLTKTDKQQIDTLCQQVSTKTFSQLCKSYRNYSTSDTTSSQQTDTSADASSDVTDSSSYTDTTMQDDTSTDSSYYSGSYDTGY
ncbi:hypothetical protein [Absicoccus intestinalis]|uniref:Uncharacterized protein n=1 Tax=Absicoccus intestinalis TaxID=2926319 RepID=A0ABU4WMU8_9FIRM|nr:hypothetical protein [Absicoccus sp. CLA-KB-P134]MDX8417886.1 hypothetical protein [Absicoccus sp. CLA-KB-P134]